MEHLLLLIKEIENQCKVDEVANPRECNRDLISGVIPERASRILDALATILVSREKSEVIAVGLQCDEPNQRIILTVAANDRIQPRTISHAETIWNNLQELGNDCHHIQQQDFGGELAYGETDVSPETLQRAGNLHRPKSSNSNSVSTNSPIRNSCLALIRKSL